MRPDERNVPRGSNPRRCGRFELFFFEQVGSRSYLRFTKLALSLILFLTIGSMALLLALFFWNRRGDSENINVNIVSPPHEPQDFSKPIIQPAPPPPSPPGILKQPRVGVPTRQTPQSPAAAPGVLSTPGPTPSPTPVVRTPP